ncbi:winged helix-turn-helix domain-containing protein [Lysobacter sp.]|uniref:winged helix-turn-helix domain-containing protein n=1 Tax=Lysobacter sp. TaxID=72226 RepID=UPI002D69D405|nr:winged helix-turn-helix domain-containing protein [Lysobacter sp.]HZX76167.1 winged helix-turn-helix domain-containing protein [Lysobacter sp.]
MRHARYRFGEYELDLASRSLSRNGVAVTLPPKSFECLAYLMAHRERAVGRDELISAVWGRIDVSDTVVAQTLLRARKALDDSGDRQARIRTVPRFGYQWVAPVEEVHRVIAPASPDATVPAAAPVSDSAPTPTPPRRHGWRFASVLIVAVLVALGALLWLRPWQQQVTPTSSTAGTIVVLPVAVTPQEPEDAWVRLGAMDYIAARLRLGGMSVLPSEQALHLGARLRTAKGEAEWARIRATSGAAWVIAPEAYRGTTGWRVRLQMFDGRRARTIDARGETALVAASAAADSWLRRMGRVPPDEGGSRPLAERVQQIDAELSAGQLPAVRRLIAQASPEQRAEPLLRVREAQLEYRAGRMDQAARVFEAVLGARTPDEDVRALALMGSGAVEIRRRQFARAEAYYSDALALLTRTDRVVTDPNLLGQAYNGRGVSRVEQGRIDDAVRDMARARVAMQQAGNLIEAAMVGTNLGIVETRRGHHSQAIMEFERAMEVFRRFEVDDYLAATLSAMAATQLTMAQPLQALQTARRADELARSVEDGTLDQRIAAVLTRAQLDAGRLRDANSGLVRLRRLGVPDDAPRMRRLAMRLALSEGRLAEADALARRLPPPEEPIDVETGLTAVQAALSRNDFGTAQAWMSRMEGATGIDAHLLTAAAQALMVRAQGDRADTSAFVDRAWRDATRADSPETRVRVGVALACLLLDKRPEAAVAVLGDLDAFVETDYRVAWAMWRLHRALGDRTTADRLERQAVALKGERDLTRVPVL